MTPAQAGDERAECAVVIDALRATTTMAALMDAGASSVSAVSDIAQARDMASAAGALLAGEVHGLPPEGFDLGNSPVEALEADLRGRDVVLFTTNGTRALCSAKADIVSRRGADKRLGSGKDTRPTTGAVRVVCAGNHGGLAFRDGGLRGGRGVRDAPAFEWRMARPTTKPHTIGSGTAREGRTATWLRAPQPSWAKATCRRDDEHWGWGGTSTPPAAPDIGSALPVVVGAGDGWVRLEDGGACAPGRA